MVVDRLPNELYEYLNKTLARSATRAAASKCRNNTSGGWGDARLQATMRRAVTGDTRGGALQTSMGSTHISAGVAATAVGHTPSLPSSPMSARWDSGTSAAAEAFRVSSPLVKLGPTGPPAAYASLAPASPMTLMTGGTMRSSSHTAKEEASPSPTNCSPPQSPLIVIHSDLNGDDDADEGGPVFRPGQYDLKGEGTSTAEDERSVPGESDNSADASPSAGHMMRSESSRSASQVGSFSRIAVTGSPPSASLLDMRSKSMVRGGSLRHAAGSMGRMPGYNDSGGQAEAPAPRTSCDGSTASSSHGTSSQGLMGKMATFSWRQKKRAEKQGIQFSVGNAKFNFKVSCLVHCTLNSLYLSNFTFS